VVETTTIGLADDAEDEAVLETLSLDAEDEAVLKTVSLDAEDEAVLKTVSLDAEDEAGADTLSLDVDDTAVADTLSLDEDVAPARTVEDAESLDGAINCRSTSWWLRSWKPAYKIHEPVVSPATRKNSTSVLESVVVALHDK
jgi:hypothetical protein